MPLAFGPPRILIADDDADTACTMAEVLQGEGYDVDIAASRHEAGKLATEKTFSLVITDLFWPHMKATRLAWPSTLRAIACPTPVGICTAWPIDPRLIENSGFVFFVGKPFELDDLITSAALAIRSEVNECSPRNAGGFWLAKRAL